VTRVHGSAYRNGAAAWPKQQRGDCNGPREPLGWEAEGVAGGGGDKGERE